MYGKKIKSCKIVSHVLLVFDINYCFFLVMSGIRKTKNLGGNKGVFLAANDAGETPLDLAQRLRHTKCEELVGIFLSLMSAEILKC